MVIGIAVIVDVVVEPGHLPRYERPQPAVGGTPDHEDGEDGSTAVRFASEVETVLRKLTPALLAQLRRDDPSTADMLVGLMFRTATLAAATIGRDRAAPEQAAEITLEQAVAAVSAAQEALYAARRDLSAAIVAGRLGGQSVPRIAERSGLDRTTIRNALAAAGLR